MLIRYRLPLVRRYWRQCHIYLALFAGLFFAMIGLTGSLSVFREDIDLWLNPDLYIEPQTTPVLSLDKVFAAVRKAHPDRHGSWTLEMPSTAHGPITAWFEKPKESVDKLYAPLMVSVNPYNGHVIKTRFWGQTFTTWILDLHTQLLLEASGRKYVAGLAVLLMISVISGLYLWWPGFARLPQAFKLRHDAGLMRFLLDVHRWLGLASAGFLLLLAFTGFHLAYPDLLEQLTASTGMGHGDSGPNVSSTAQPNDKPIGLEEAVLVARGLFPSSEVRRISTPAGELGTYRINLRQKKELNQHHPFTNVWIDRWSGQIKSVNNPSQFSIGQQFTTWQWPLHTGEAFGGQRWLWSLIGLTPLTLWLSGMMHWLYRQGLIADRPLDWAQWTAQAKAMLNRLRRYWSAQLPRLISFTIRQIGQLLDRYKR